MTASDQKTILWNIVESSVKHETLGQTNHPQAFSMFLCSLVSVFQPLYLSIFCVSGESLAVKSTGPPMTVRDKEGEPHRGTYLMLHANTLMPVLPLRPLTWDLVWSLRPDQSPLLFNSNASLADFHLFASFIHILFLASFQDLPHRPIHTWRHCRPAGFVLGWYIWGGCSALTQNIVDL